MKAETKLVKGSTKATLTLEGTRVIETRNFLLTIDGDRYYKTRKLALAEEGFAHLQEKKAPEGHEKERPKTIKLLGRSIINDRRKK